MNVGDVCQSEVVTIPPSAGLSAAARVMRQEHVGYLVVVEPMAEEGQRRVVGVLTDRDIVIAVVAREADPRTLTVGDVMTRDPLFVNERSPLETTLGLMQEVGVRRVPVLGSSGALAGVLALDDALKVIALQLEKIAGCIGSEQKVERCVRA
jgi:CBS domain-containing protein